jgi:hypothetical protein
MLLPSSRSKTKPSKKLAYKQMASRAIALLGSSCHLLFFDPEDGGDMFLRNFG